MKLEVEINISGNGLDKADLEKRVRRETILSLLADRKLGLAQAADELQLTQADLLALLRQRGSPACPDDTSPNSGHEVPLPSLKQRSVRDRELLERARSEAAQMPRQPSLNEVRAALACLPDSIAEVVIAERGEY